MAVEDSAIVIRYHQGGYLRRSGYRTLVESLEESNWECFESLEDNEKGVEELRVRWRRGARAV